MKRWEKVIIYLTLSCFLAALLPMPAMAASLWGTEGKSSLFTDHRARQIGDILTIIINESSSASRSGRTANSKDYNANLEAGTGIFRWLAAASAEMSDSFNAQGSLSNTNRMNARLTVEVVDILPNGNLVVAGTQTIVQNKDKQQITVKGVVRPQDISPDNTVLSTYVANAELILDGHGPQARKQRQGILSQLFDFLF